MTGLCVLVLIESDYQYQPREYDFSNEFLINFDDDANGAVKNVNFSLIPFQSSNIKIEGRFENLSDRSLTDLTGYEARVRLVGENSIYEAKVSSDGLFSLEVEEAVIRYTLGSIQLLVFPDWNSSDYYEIGEPYM